MQNYYQLLGITRNATAIEVKAAFQKQMKALESSHVHGEHRETQEKMLRQAFLTLLDAARRAKYDKQVDAAARPVVVRAPVETTNVSVSTIALVAVVLAAIVAGGWYFTRPSAKKREEIRLHDEEVARSAREKVQAQGPRSKNPNPFRDGPPSATKDQIMKNAIDRAAKETQAPRKPAGAAK